MTPNNMKPENLIVPFSSLMRCLGFSVLLVTNDLILREPAVFTNGLSPVAYDQTFARIILNIAFIGGLIVVGLISLIRKQEADKQKLFFLQCVTGILCVLLLSATVLDSFNMVSESVLLYTSSFFLGLFAALGLLSWISILSEINPGSAWLEIVLSLFISSLGYVFVLYAAESFSTAVLFSAVYLLSLVLNGWFCLKTMDCQNMDDTAFVDDRFTAIRKNIPVVLCIAALNFVMTASRMSLFELSTEAINSICAAGICLAALLLFVSSFIIRKDIEIGVLYQVAFPFIALIFLLLPFLGNGVKSLFMLLATALATMGTTVLILIALQAKNTLRSSATCVYSICSSFVHIALLLGFITTFDNTNDGSSVVQNSVLALVIVYAFLLVFIASQRNSAKRSKKSAVFVTSEQSFLEICNHISEENGLTLRESEIMRELMLGKSASPIAKELGISVSTVKTHVKNIYKKLDIHTKSELLELVMPEIE